MWHSTSNSPGSPVKHHVAFHFKQSRVSSKTSCGIPLQTVPGLQMVNHPKDHVSRHSGLPAFRNLPTGAVHATVNIEQVGFAHSFLICLCHHSVSPALPISLALSVSLSLSYHPSSEATIYRV